MNKEISTTEFKKRMSLLVGKKLSHMDLYYQKIDLHFGEYFKDEDVESGDIVLYVSGVWNVIKSGKIILDETYEQSMITEFFYLYFGSIVKNITIQDSPKQINIEFSTDFILSVTADDDSHWIELLERNGSLMTYKQDKIILKQG